MTLRRRPDRPRRVGKVAPGLVLTAGYTWRLLLVGVAGYAAFVVLQRLQLVAVAVFLGLVVTSVLRPAADALAKLVPRGVAVAIVMVAAVVLVAGLLTLAGELVASDWNQLRGEVRGGLNRIERWLQGPPLHLRAGAVSGLRSKVGSYLSAHRSSLISTAVSSAGRLVEAITGGALALFCAVFFIYSGDRMWRWAAALLPARARPRFELGGRVAWRTFAGYTRGIVIVSATNAVLVGIALLLLGVPLVVPLMLLEFLATFIPLIGSPIALAVASVVALATQGPLTALILLILIVVIGQIEGHVLHPLVLSWAVRIHPVVVALAVAVGTLVEGVIGAVVAVPLVSVAWAVYRELRAR
ncbi:AI-2E family transporter [Kitasatospora sp. GAS204B]|uniref:AI-2E family transporter n=1 Tax=unclassified Kitasatospora TaxID=2633591 RepID=UPI0024730F7E|nr:AI-2E family transporter [Kitasatospora sp. GAS204B]MDH6117755.1 putative PurR-regulated permease PerM [Kitasatospora sp. GAS204B]